MQFLLFALLFVTTSCGHAQDLHKVERIVDGDTFVLVGGEKVRLIGIDTPETVKPNTPVQPFGPEATQLAKTLLEGRSVRLELDVQERDRYGRLLAYVYLEDGTFVNAEMLKHGLAMVMTRPPNVKFSDEFVKLQQQAREDKRGMWEMSNGQ